MCALRKILWHIFLAIHSGKERFIIPFECIIYFECSEVFFLNSIVADVYFVMIIMSLGYNIILKILYILSWSISKIKNKVQGKYFGNSKCFNIFMSTRNAIDEITVQLIHFTYIIITIALPVHMLKCEQTYRKFSVIWYLKKCDPRIFGYS